MEAETARVVADWPAVATCGGSEKRLILLSLRALATIATTSLKVRESSSYRSLPKLVAVVATPARTLTSMGVARNSASSRLARTSAGWNAAHA